MKLSQESRKKYRVELSITFESDMNPDRFLHTKRKVCEENGIWNDIFHGEVDTDNAQFYMYDTFSRKWVMIGSLAATVRIQDFLGKVVQENERLKKKKLSRAKAYAEGFADGQRQIAK